MVTQAIIPLAGLGTRLLPLSSVIPKELLPINGKPNLEYIMEECIQAGIKQFIFVVPKNRPCLLYTSPSPRDRQKSRMPSSA